MTHPPLHIDELVEHWTILDDERDLVAGKRGATRLAFAILLKFYTQYGRFPRGRSELPDQVVEHVAKQVQVSASELGFYEWSGSTIEYHRNQIRTHLGFRTCTTADATKVTGWLAENVAHAERRPERVREEVLKHLREEKIEPPTPGADLPDRRVGAAQRGGRLVPADLLPVEQRDHAPHLRGGRLRQGARRRGRGGGRRRPFAGRRRR
ncbi:DUF4158 domain-containing protein [Nonomuraea fuscirosea]|uniref:DUF4158 domain-containing protein n=1 Tax=Nonomuraea fuscirosea TaxID=1291556 RepID=UPI0034054D3E